MRYKMVYSDHILVDDISAKGVKFTGIQRPGASNYKPPLQINVVEKRDLMSLLRCAPLRHDQININQMTLI
jgi:hypothetical protein